MNELDLVVERWTSDQGNEERHHYLVKEGHHEVYFFGINPRLFSEATIEAMRDTLIDALRTAEEENDADR